MESMTQNQPSLNSSTSDGGRSRSGNRLYANDGTAENKTTVAALSPTSSTTKPIIKVETESSSRKRIRLSLKRSSLQQPKISKVIASNPGTRNATERKEPLDSLSMHNSSGEPLIIKTEEDGAVSCPPKKKIRLVLSKVKREFAQQAEDTSYTAATRSVAPSNNQVSSSFSSASGKLKGKFKTEPDHDSFNGSSSNGETNADPPSHATILENIDHNMEDDAVAEAVEEPQVVKGTKSKGTQSIKKEGTGRVQESSSTPGKEHGNTTIPARSVRLPPMSSPGLLIPPGIYKGQINADGLVSPNVVFLDAMNTAGYNLENRRDHPHRGSSVQRVVDDMYDSDVKFCLNYPELVPAKCLQNQAEAASTEGVSGETETKHTHNDSTSASEGKSASTEKLSLAERLIKALETSEQDTDTEHSQTIQNHRPGKRSRLRRFTEMIPLSLTLPYPEWYILKRLDYVKQVDEREKAIVAKQEEEEAIEIAKERCEATRDIYTGPTASKIVVPPIPNPPDPPMVEEMKEYDAELYSDRQHPYYRPKEEFVGHLDKRCFHITDGRYFGLTSNGLVDPHFVGPNAPGISGLQLSSTSGLATFNTSGSGVGSALFDASAVTSGPRYSAALGIVSAKSSLSSSVGQSQASKSKKKSVDKSIIDKKMSPAKAKVEDPSTSSILSKNGPTVTASAADLKKIMEDGGEEAEQMRITIIKAAVHAVRAGKYDSRSFRGPNRKVYPDVAKAFSAHSGLKPCSKCKGNKQGTYHCRFRRKHEEVDFDGGNSWQALGPFFEMPLSDLLIKPLKKKENQSP